MCRDDPSRKQVWGCTEKTQMSRPTFEEEEIEGDQRVITKYWRCPVKYIPSSVLRFVDDYRYIKQFPGTQMPALEDTNPKWREAVSYYELQMAEFTALMRKEK